MDEGLKRFLVNQCKQYYRLRGEPEDNDSFNVRHHDSLGAVEHFARSLCVRLLNFQYLKEHDDPVLERIVDNIVSLNDQLDALGTTAGLERYYRLRAVDRRLQVILEDIVDEYNIQIQDEAGELQPLPVRFAVVHEVPDEDQESKFEDNVDLAIRTANIKEVFVMSYLSEWITTKKGGKNARRT